MYLLFLLFSVYGVSVSAQPAPEPQFLRNSDSLLYRVETKLSNSGKEPISGRDFNMTGGSDFDLRIASAKEYGDTIRANGYITNVTASVNMPDDFDEDMPRDTVMTGWPHEGKRFIMDFDREGELLRAYAAEEDEEFSMSLDRFVNMLKLGFVSNGASGRTITAGESWKLIEHDTEMVAGSPVTSITHTHRTWHGVIDTLGERLTVFTFVVDSASIGGDAFGGLVNPTINPGATRGTLGYRPASGHLSLAHTLMSTSMTMEIPADEAAPNKQPKQPKKKGKAKPAPTPKMTSVTMTTAFDVRIKLLD